MRNIELTKGNILASLTALALPIMATSFIQMAYNLTDMLWIGKIGSDAVASVGAAGMFTWFSNGLILIARMGGQVKSAHALGAGNQEEAGLYASMSLQLALAAAIGFGIISVLFADLMIGFFAFESASVIADAKSYLMMTCSCIVFAFLNQMFTGLLTAAGNSKISFGVNTVGLILNIVLDPLCIFGFGLIPAMGVFGAALATVLSQAIVTGLFLIVIRKEKMLFPYVHIMRKPCGHQLKEIIQIGAPAGLQNMLFSSISMVLGRIVASFGAAAVAVQKVGSQIESISWMTSDGFAAALNSFTAQNHGARNPQRVKQGFRISMRVMCSWGIITSLILYVFAQPLFQLFISEADVIPMGAAYLQILGFSQLFMCIEITTAGVLNGLGKTLPPSIVSISFNLMRIPLAMLLTQWIGLEGIWWALTITSIFKGCVLYGYYRFKISGKCV